MRAAKRPVHLLPLGKTSAHNLVDRRFDERRADRFALPVPLTEIRKAVSAVEAAIDLDSNEYRYWGNLGIYCRWAPGNESKSAPALRRAIELATKHSETTKSDYAVHANLAEYRARLGDATGAIAEIERIPVTARGPLTTRLAIVYELTGHRDLAVDVIRSNLKRAASLNQIKDDPDLGVLWREARLQ